MKRAIVETRSVEGRHFVFVYGYLKQLGGAERQAFLLARHLRDHYGARVSFLSWIPPEGMIEQMFAAEGIPVHVYPLDIARRRGRAERAFASARLFGLARFLRRSLRPHYLLPYVGENCKVAGAVWKLAGARYTWWNQRDEGRDLQGSRYEHYLMRTLPDVVSNSWEGRDALLRVFGVASTRVRVLNNAVVLPEMEDRREWRARLGLGSDDRLISMVANLTQYKDHETLVRAFAELVSERDVPHIHLALAGRLAERTVPLKALAFDLGLSGQLHVLGAVSDIDDLYRSSDLVVHSSKLEGCPNGVLEAMAHGRCVLGTDISGIRQALGDAVAARCTAPPGDARALARLIEDWLTREADREAIGAANRTRIATDFTPDGLAREVLAGISRYERDHGLAQARISKTR